MGVETKTKDEVIIQSPSQELVRELILTAPIEPSYVNMNLVAYGIPARCNDNEWQAYCDECKARNVMPFTSTKLVYDKKSNSFVPQLPDELGNIIQIYSTASERIDTLVERLVEGGKIHEYIIDIRFPAHEGFRRLRHEGLLQKLFDEDYHVERGRFSFLSYLGKEFSVPSVLVGFNPEKVVILADEGCSEEKEKYLRDWLDGVKEKYEKINPLPADKHQAS